MRVAHDRKLEFRQVEKSMGSYRNLLRLTKDDTSQWTYTQQAALHAAAPAAPPPICKRMYNMYMCIFEYTCTCWIPIVCYI